MIRNLKKAYSFLLRKKSELYNELLGDKNYKKFVIISQSRTGSTLLMALLNNHENIICEGELFKSLGGNSCRQVWDKFFGKKPKKIQQVGFKLFYSHATKGDQTVWDFIENDKSITIVHLVRKNWLRVLVSQKIGLKTKLWTENIDKPHQISTEDKKVEISYDDCEKSFLNAEFNEQNTRDRFSNHPFVEVTYEDLSKDADEVIHKITNVLNVNYQKVKAKNKKQNTEPLKELVINFSELKEKFKNSKWEYLFSETIK
jgi:LPS sulfotransferase NodH